jgi:ABC-type polysaccharide/polyol phosphate export permease
MVKGALKALVILNPFAYFIVAFQNLIILGQPLSVWHWLAMVVLSGGTFALGSWFFTKAKLAIIDYL